MNSKWLCNYNTLTKKKIMKKIFKIKLFEKRYKLKNLSEIMKQNIKFWYKCFSINEKSKKIHKYKFIS